MKLTLIVHQILSVFRRRDDAVSENVNQKVVRFEDCVRINNARFKTEEVPQISARNQYFAAIVGEKSA